MVEETGIINKQKQEGKMDVKTLFHNNGSEILFRLKLDVLGGIADIKSLVSDLAEIIEKYETETLEAKA